MEALNDTLSHRIDELLHACKSEQLLSTTGSQRALIELAGRVEGLEQALREVTVAVESLLERQSTT